MAYRHIFDIGGQSNQLGFPSVIIAAPAGIPLASVLLWNHAPTKVASGEENWAEFRTLRARDTGEYGSELTFGLALAATGRRFDLLKVSQGSTSMDDWRPSDPEHADLHDKWVTAMTNAVAALRLLYPNDTFVYWLHWNQGENDAGSLAAANGWAGFFGQVKAAREAVIGQSYAGVMCTLTRADQYDPTIVAALRAAQISVSDVYADMNGLANNGVHLTGAGYNDLGLRQFAAFLPLLNARFPMGSPSTFAKNTLIDHFRNKATYSPAATHYFHLYSGGVALTNGNSPGYAAASATNNTTTWPTPSGRAVANGVAITYGAASGTWLSPDEVRITDNSTAGAGNELGRDTFTSTPVDTGTGPFSFAVGAITITAATGCFVDTVAHGLLGLMFGGTAYTQLATVYGSYWAGDPQGAGAQAGSRVAITQATAWNSASAGLAVTGADITLTQQATGTFYAEHDASVAGNLLFSASRPASTGAAGTILAGQLQTTIT